MPKPHRILIDRVSGYADEAGAFVRRRRLTRRPFARLYYPTGRSADHADDSEIGEKLFEAAGSLIELGGTAEERAFANGRKRRNG